MSIGSFLDFLFHSICHLSVCVNTILLIFFFFFLPWKLYFNVITVHLQYWSNPFISGSRRNSDKTKLAFDVNPQEFKL